MHRLIPTTFALFILGTVHAQPADKPITTTKGPLGDLLRKWHSEGTAAGNVGDWYDNRDGDHSPLNLAPWPQMQAVVYTPDDIKARRHWAAQGIVRPTVTFGNSSTSAPPLTGGSNIRMYYTQPRGLELLYQHYRKNNLYIYPEHRDHDRRAEGGYGDLYPTNTPFLIASQGSSGSDQPFMRAIPYTLAAFRPDVKKKLIEEGLLMPTLQLVFRLANKHLTDPADYLTGKAHPTVFEGSWVNDLKMVQLAHDITVDTIPPLAQLQVTEEKRAENGRDFFELNGRSEVLADTPVVIARIVRGPEQVRRLVVSAEGSFDVNKRPLKYHWSVLRGDEKRIVIKPLNDVGSVVELKIPYHDRFMAGPVPIESTRVDIGCFVHNGAHWSAPGFITFHYLDNEARTYDEQGRLVEIGYGAGETTLTIGDWNKLFALLKQDDAGLPRELLLKNIPAAERAIIDKVGEEYQAASARHVAAQAASKTAQEMRQKLSARLKQADDDYRAALKSFDEMESDETLDGLLDNVAVHGQVDAERKTADKQVQDAQREVNDQAKSAEDVLTRNRDGLAKPVRPLVMDTLKAYQHDPDFLRTHRQAIEAITAKDAARQAKLDAVLKGLPAAGALSRFQRQQLERGHAELLAGVLYPGIVTQTFQANVADPRLTQPKPWRDIYRHDATGQIIGWTRHQAGETKEYHFDGSIVLDKDDQGRPTRCRTVRYEAVDPKRGFFDLTIKPVLDADIVNYEYNGPEDRRGKIAKREPAP